MIYLRPAGRVLILIFTLSTLSFLLLLSRQTCNDSYPTSLTYTVHMTSSASTSSHGYHGNLSHLVTAVDCRAIMEGSDGGKELQKAREYLNAHPYTKISDQDLLKLVTSDCDVTKRFVTSYYEWELENGEGRESMKEEEERFPIAFTLLVHKDASQVLRLLRQIYRPYNYYCIHVDSKLTSHDLFNIMTSVAECLPNVYLPQVRESVIYGHYTRLKAELNCMQRLLTVRPNVKLNTKFYNHINDKDRPQVHEANNANNEDPANDESNLDYEELKKRIENSTKSELEESMAKNRNDPGWVKPWRYVINLTGQMFPLKTNLEIVRILSIYNGSNDIEALSRWHLERLRSRVDFVWIAPQGKLGRTKTRHVAPPRNINLVKGSAYGAFTYEFIEYVLSEPVVQEFLAWSQHIFSPDEVFWATINSRWVNPVFHSPGGYDAAPERKPWMASHSTWKGAGECGGKFVRASCIFGLADLPRLVGRRELFANKFYEDFEYLTVDCLEEWLRNKTMHRLPMDLQYYRTIKEMLDYKN